jgi:hypothetical protein
MVNGGGFLHDAFGYASNAQGLSAELNLTERFPLPRLIHRVEIFALIGLIYVRRLFVPAAVFQAEAIQFAFIILTSKAGTLFVCG